MTEDQIIDEYLDAVALAWSAMDFRTFNDTVDIFLYDPLIAQPWTQLHTLLLLSTIREKGMSPKEVGSKLHNPTAIRCMFYYDLFMAKFARFGISSYMEIFRFYSDILHAICREDVFAKNKKNIIHDAGQVSVMAGRCQPADPDTARILGKLANACYNLSYGLYSDMNPQLTYDNFGPYYRPDKKLFALKIW